MSVQLNEFSETEHTCVTQEKNIISTLEAPCAFF